MGPSFRTFKLWMMDDFTAKWGFSRGAANREGRRASRAASEGTPEHRESQTALAKEEGCILRLLQTSQTQTLVSRCASFPKRVCGGSLVASKDQCDGVVASQKAHVWFVSSGLTEETWQIISTPAENWLAALLKVWSVGIHRNKQCGRQPTEHPSPRSP